MSTDPFECASIDTRIELFGNDGRLQKELLTDENVGSIQSGDLRGYSLTDEGCLFHTFNKRGARAWIKKNATHGACIRAKVACTVGLGMISDQEKQATEAEAGQAGINSQDILQFIMDPDFHRSKAESQLDKLCLIDFQDLLSRGGSDFFELGDMAIEVRRDSKNPIDGEVKALYYLPTDDLYAYSEGNVKDYHFNLGFASDIETAFCRFGDKRRFMGTEAAKSLNPEKVSEVIYIPDPLGGHFLYGEPSWLATAPAMEVANAAWEEKLSDYVNRCIVDFLLFIHGPGTPIGKTDWDKIRSAIGQTSEIGKKHQSVAHAFSSSTDAKIFFQQITKDSKTDEAFQKNYEVTKMDIVTGHQVPPLLAGIQIPGKLGANNEFVNALMSFQALVIGKAQRVISRALSRTLGDTKESGLKIAPDAFNFRKVTDYIDIKTADTIGRMRESATEAQANGRDLSEGVKE
jgi:hypothetical protein